MGWIKDEFMFPFEEESIMDWHTSTSPEIAEMTEHQVCIIPLGCLERHADHLPTGCDGLVAQHFAQLAAEREPCMVLPPLYYAIHFAGRNATGAICMPTITFLEYLERICDDVARNGFKKIILLNAHGSNGATLSAFLHMIADKGKDYAVFLPPLWLCGDAIAKVKQTSVTGHACEIETSIAMHLFPEHVRKDAIPERLSDSLKDYDVAPAATQLDWYGSFPDQYAGDARAATADKGRQIVEAQVEALAELVRKIKSDTRVIELLEQYRQDMAAPRATVAELTHGRRGRP